jgi:hypothetical protein
LREKRLREIKETGVQWVRNYIEEFLWIRDKNTELVPFKLNKTQNYAMDIIEDVWTNRLLPRFICLKARQEGISTLIQAIFFTITINQPLITSKTISYEEDSAISLFDMSERFYRHLPAEFQPNTQAYTKKSLVLKDRDSPENSLDSRIVIDTAKNLKSGRSETLNFLHVSEMAFFDQGLKLLISLFPSVPKTPKSMIFIESTANGQGNEFHTRWENAHTLREIKDDPFYEELKSSFIKIFIPWYWHIEYSRPITKSFKPYTYNHPTFGDEALLMKQYSLTKQQIAWRRSIIKTDCLNELETFQQEYPANDVEAFLASGNTIFNKQALKELLDGVLAPKEKGYLIRIQDQHEAEMEYGGNRPELKWRRDEEGDVLIWEHPQEGEFYMIGGDVAEGIEISQKETDNSVLHVYKRSNWKLVATYCGKIDPDLLGDVAYDMGWYYNLAWLAIEKNNHGLVTLKRLQKLGYPLIYFKIIIDEKTDKKTKKLGWETNSVTRPLMVEDFKMLVRERVVKIYDKETIKEMLTFIRKPDGKAEHAEGKKDDRVIASAIAYQGHKSMPLSHLPKPSERKRRRRYGYTRAERYM